MNIIHYFVTAEDGTVIQSGTCQEGLLEKNACEGILHKGEAPKGAFRYINGEFVPVVREVSYSEKRAMAYPPVSEQLDALWHSMDAGQIAKSEPFYSMIKEVKVAHPKPL